ncbi:MAG: hypothetical protein HFJ66_10550 [Eggerthellaceae bacterium]|nr:hypothetical protein [Eggerthellaceae bacterium]
MGSSEHGGYIEPFGSLASALEPCAQKQPRPMSQAMHLMAASHQVSTLNSKHFDLLTQSLRYEEELLTYGPIEELGYAELKQLSTEVFDLALRDNAPIALSHRAFLLANSGTENDRRALEENSGLQSSDYATDFGTYVVTRNLNASEVAFALEEYLGRKPTDIETRHHWAMIGLAGWTGYVWCLLEEVRCERTLPEKKRCRRFADTYLTKALSLYTE